MGITLHFVLKSSDSDQPTSIFVRFKKRGKRFVWSIGRDRMIHPELWDKNSQRPIHTKRTSNESERNSVRYLIKKYEQSCPTLKTDLENIENRITNVEEHIREFISKREEQNETLDYSELKDSLNKRFTPSKKNAQKPIDDPIRVFITEYFENYVLAIEKGKVLQDSGANHGQRYSYGTIKTYKTSLRKWKDFESSLGLKIRWSDLGKDLYDKLLSYCNSKNLSANYIGRIVKHLKVVSRRAYESGIHNNQEFQKRYFKAFEEKTESIALTGDELERIRTVDLSHVSSKYSLYRDVFLVGCYTALRYSDYSRLGPEHIKGNFIDIINKKTNKRVKIPLHPYLKEILTKYGNKLPKTYPQHLNDHIKEIGRMAKIDDPIEYRVIKGGMTVKKTKPKYELIQSHTARRTGATLMYLHSKNALGVMKITGHATESDFMRYIKIDVDQNARLMAQSTFFSPLKKVQ